MTRLLLISYNISCHAYCMRQHSLCSTFHHFHGSIASLKILERYANQCSMAVPAKIILHYRQNERRLHSPKSSAQIYTQVIQHTSATSAKMETKQAARPISPIYKVKMSVYKAAETNAYTIQLCQMAFPMIYRRSCMSCASGQCGSCVIMRLKPHKEDAWESFAACSLQ